MDNSTAVFVEKGNPFDLPALVSANKKNSKLNLFKPGILGIGGFSPFKKKQKNKLNYI